MDLHIQVPLGPKPFSCWFMSHCSVQAPLTEKTESKARKVRFYCVFSVGPKVESLNTKLEAGIFCTAWAELKKLLPDESLAGS